MVQSKKNLRCKPTYSKKILKLYPFFSFVAFLHYFITYIVCENNISVVYKDQYFNKNAR